MLIGDVRKVLETMEPHSVDMVMTSPPYFQLRSYLPGDHELKSDEIGLEATPAEYIDHLLDVMELLDRVLAPHGSVVVDLGDVAGGSGGLGGDGDEGGMREGMPHFDGTANVHRDPKSAGRTRRFGESILQREARLAVRDPYHLGRSGLFDQKAARHSRRAEDLFPLDKSLGMIPESFRWAIAYGMNPFNGRRTPRWIVRNVVVWCKENPPPGRVGDRFRRGTSTLVVATRAPQRWYDDFEVRRPPKEAGRIVKPTSRRAAVEHNPAGRPMQPNVDGVPPLDWWVIPSRTYRSKTTHQHWAAFPEKLCEIPILTMCPPKVCTFCGRAPMRITEPSETYATKLGRSIYPKNETRHDRQRRGRRGAHEKKIVRDHSHVGWDECECFGVEDRWRRGVVLDPFGGTGTTAVVANRYGRDAVLIDFDGRNLEIVQERIADVEVG